MRYYRLAESEEKRGYLLDPRKALDLSPSEYYPPWLQSALDAAIQGRLTDMLKLKSDEEARGIWTLFADMGKNKENFFKIPQHPFVKGNKFGPDVDVLTMTLPSNFPMNAGKARHAFRHQLADYIAIRHAMRSMELSSSLTPEAVAAEKLFGGPPGLPPRGMMMKYLPK